ncbi:MAG: hypothetical protein CMJ83_12095 [Planctomycetes bacterium]|nr:hypothetical protein [Planctomycetota bacterium]
MSRLYVLGAGGRVPTQQRQTCCYVLETRRGLVFLDAGTGVSRLHDPLFQGLLTRSRRVRVLLCGYSLDRIAGLSWLPTFLGDHELVIAGPPSAGEGPEAVLMRTLAPPFHPGGFEAWRSSFASVSFQTFEDGKNLVAGEPVLVRMLAGDPEPSCAVRVREAVYATGCVARPETAELASRASVLVHDASRTSDAAGGEVATSASAAEAATLAQEALVQDLILAHLGPDQDTAAVESMLFEATARFPRSVTAADMMCFKMAGVPDEEELTEEELAEDDADVDAEDEIQVS